MISLYGYELNPPKASDANEPNDGIGALTPKPKKDRKLSVKIADGI